MMGLSKLIQETIPLASALLCAALAGVIWMPLSQDSDPRAALGDVPVAVTGPDTSQILAEGAQELLNRPLFHITRRPPTVVTVPEVTPVAVTLSLVGIVNSNDVQIALLRLSNRAEVLRRQVGDKVGDWEIVAISENSVTVITPTGGRDVMSLAKSQP